MASHYVDPRDYREPAPPPGGFRYAPPRDALTGEPIRADTIHKRVRPDEREDNQPTRAQRADGWRADLTARPLRLHTQAVETAADAGDMTRGALGGHAFSRQFAAYLAQVKPLLLSQADAEARYWWLSDYGQRRVRQRFQARYGYATGLLAYHAAAAVAAHYRTTDEVMLETGHTASWVARMCVLAARFAYAPASTDKGETNAAKINHIAADERRRARVG